MNSVPDSVPGRNFDSGSTLILTLKNCRSPLEKTRYETSLGLLTKKFVSLFHSDPTGTVDLNKETAQSLFIYTNTYIFTFNTIPRATLDSIY